MPQVLLGAADIQWMTRLLIALALMASACTTPARIDTAPLPAVSSTTTVPPTTTTQPLPTTTSTTVPAAGPDVIAWLAEEAAAQTLLEAVTGWEGVAGIELVTAEEAYDEFVALFSDRPELVNGVSAGDLPQSLRVELAHPSFVADVAAGLRSLSDVTEVATAVTPTCNAFPDWNVVVFADDDRQLSRLRNQLVAEEGITEVAVVGRDEAFAEYLARFGQDTALVSGIEVQDMSVSLRAHTSNPITLSLVAGRFEGDPAVKGVQVFNPGAPPCR